MTGDARQLKSGFGGFRLAGMNLALPMQALREVVPMGQLMPLPCPAPFVVGGISLRGVLVPVVDLRIVLGQPTPALDMPSVIVVVFDDRILGVLVESVSSVFDTAPGRFHAAEPGETSDATAAIFAGSVHRDEDDALVSVLSAGALAGLPQLPLVRDPEPGRRQLNDDAELAPRERNELHLMLVRCGRLALAVDAMAVYTTLANPDVQPSVLAQGNCVGVIDFAGARVPAIDLLGLCQLGRLEADSSRQAFVIQAGAGFVALIVESVVDIVVVGSGDTIALPRFLHGEQRLFRGALAAGVALNGKSAVIADDDPPYLLLDGDILKLLDEVVAMARMNTVNDAPAAAARVPASARSAPVADQPAGGEAPSQSMLTYSLDGEAATPLEQVQEILPYSPGIATFATPGPAQGILVNRGRTIPVVCLRQMISGQPCVPSADTALLVVQSDGEFVGFIVPALRGIEPARWQPVLGSAGMLSSRRTDSAGQKLALVGNGSDARMVPVLNLLGIARDILGQTAPAPEKQNGHIAVAVA